MAPLLRNAAAIAGAILGVALVRAAAPRFDSWTIAGPGGGGGHFIPTISPHDARRVLVACDMTGSFISHDGGESWRLFHLGNRTDLFAFDPSRPDTIYAKTGPPPAVMANDRPVTLTGLYRSTDAGQSWSLVHEDGGDWGTIKAFAVDPGNPQGLYAAVETGGKDVLRISSDGGASWADGRELPAGTQAIYADPRSTSKERTLHIAGADAITTRAQGAWSTGPAVGSGARPPQFSIGFPGEGPAVVYAIRGSMVHVSEDGGKSWRESPLPGLGVPRLLATATSLHHPDHAYVSFANAEGGAFGVARTSDRGRTWSIVWKENTAPGANIRDAWLSERFGPRWGGAPGQLGVAPRDPKIAYGTDSGRTMRTTDGGATWTGVYSRKQSDGTWNTTGLDVTTAYGVHFDPFDIRRIFISYTDIGLFRSENGGGSWQSATMGVPRQWTNTTYWIEFDPEVRGRVWGAMAGAHDLPRPKMWMNRPQLAYPGGVCRSSDGGRTWTVSNEGMPATAVTHVLLDPTSPKEARTLYATGFATGVYKSTDGGANWALKNSGIEGAEPFAWRLARDRNGTLYLVVARRSDDGSIGTPGDGALYRSTDGAASWTRMQLPGGVNGPHGIAIDPRDPKRLYLAAWGRRHEGRTSGGGIFVSTDAGRTWRHVHDRDQHIYDITIDPRNPFTLYASGFGASAWRSADRGSTWTRIRGFNFKWGHRVVPDPADHTRIYVTTYGGSVWHGPATGDPAATEDVVPRTARRNDSQKVQ